MAKPRKNQKATRAARPVRTDPWLTVVETARALTMAPQTVYARAAAGLLDTQVVAGRTFVSRESVERLRARLASEAEEEDAAVRATA
jgi:hypothetical protein